MAPHVVQICQGVVDGKRPELTDKAQADHRLDREDSETQIEAVRHFVERGNYAVARAELRGAILFLARIEKRDAR